MAERTKTWLDRGKDALRTTTALIAIGGIGVAAAGCTTEAKPPATSPAVPGDTDPNQPSPSEGNPPASPENPGDNETDPLAPENLWAASEQERLEAVRIPEGTSPEEWVELYANYKEALLNAAVSEKAYQDWRATNDDGSMGSCSRFVFGKIHDALKQLSGPFDVNGTERLVLYRACVMHSNRELANEGEAGAILPHITYKAEAVKEANGGIVYKSYLYDNIDEAYVEYNKTFDSTGKQLWLNKDGSSSVMSHDPALLIADKLHYDKNQKSVTPRNIKPYTASE